MGLEIWRSQGCASWYISIVKFNQMHQCLKFILFGVTLYMFRTVFPSIISSSSLYVQQQSNRYCCLLASKQTAVSVWLVSVHGLAEAEVGVREDSSAVKMCTQTIMPNAQSKFCKCLSSTPVCKVYPPSSGAPWATFYMAKWPTTLA